jgi:PTS system nitrogen regulatory IIA component
MDIRGLLSPADILVDLPAPDKSRLLSDLSTRAASTLQLDAGAIASQILKREALGSTGVGGGVAIPHARIPGLRRPFGVIARLRRPIAFDAIDEQPVDVVFLLLLPAAAEGEQLNALATVARKLRDKPTLRNIRTASDAATLYQAFMTDAVTPGAGDAGGTR